MNNAPKVSSSLNGSIKSVLRVRVEVDKPVMQDMTNPVVAVKQDNGGLPITICCIVDVLLSILAQPAVGSIQRDNEMGSIATNRLTRR